LGAVAVDVGNIRNANLWGDSETRSHILCI